MSRKHARVSRSVAFVCFVFLFGLSASAGYLYTWGAANLSDNNDIAEARFDILGLWTAQDSTYYYFRMDVESAPGAVVGGGAYMVYIDTDQNSATGATGDPGGSSWGTDPNSSYVANPIAGIEEIVDAHYNSGGSLTANHEHTYNGTAPFYFDLLTVAAVGGFYQNTENSGNTLEWRIPVSVLGTAPMRLYGATLLPGVNDQTVYDITGSFDFTPTDYSTTAVPEPGTLVLLGVVSGVGCVMSRRRRRKA